MKTNFFLITCLFLVLGCSRVQTLNMREHKYSKKPEKIIWLQVAGFSDELLPLLKFNNLSADISLFADRADCIGKMWNYNLFNLRPKANMSFLSQMYGLKNVKNNCEMMKKESIIQASIQNNYQVYIFENAVSNEDSYEQILNCQPIENLRLFKMAQSTKPSNLFHYQELNEDKNKNLPSGVYYDKACQKGNCYSTLLSNLKSVLVNELKENSNSLIIIRDFKLLEATKNKDIYGLKENLGEIGQVIKWFELNSGNESLILVSGAESTQVDFPNEGLEWEEYVKSNKNIFFRTSSLLSTVISKGSMAESFCGLFDESEMFNRLNFPTPKRVFDWDNLNPFAN